MRGNRCLAGAARTAKVGVRDRLAFKSALKRFDNGFLADHFGKGTGDIFGRDVGHGESITYNV